MKYQLLFFVLFQVTLVIGQFPGQKLGGTQYIKSSFRIDAESDTVWKAYSKTKSTREEKDSVIYMEIYKAGKFWKLFRYKVESGKWIIDGDQFEFDMKGRPNSVLHCATGQKKCSHWTAFTWWNNNRINKQGDFINGKPEGEHRTWYDNGQLRSLIKYDQGKLTEVIQLYDIDGNALERGSLTRGFGTVLIYSLTGKLIEERNYINGKLKSKRKY